MVGTLLACAHAMRRIALVPPLVFALAVPLSAHARSDFDPASKQFHYDGAAFREILRRHPRSPEAAEARSRLQSLTAAPR